MSEDGEVNPVPLKEDGLFVIQFLFKNYKFIFGDILGFEHIMKALFGEQVTKLLYTGTANNIRHPNFRICQPVVMRKSLIR